MIPKRVEIYLALNLYERQEVMSTKSKNLREEYINNLRETEKIKLIDNSSLIKSFKEYCSKKGIKLNDNHFKYSPAVGIVAEYPNILKILCNKIKIDNEGLHDYKKLESFYKKSPHADGYFYGDNFMLMVHQYFRRSFSFLGGFSPCFIEKFWRYNNSEVEKSIRLDSNRVRIDVNEFAYTTKDFWFMPPFSKEIIEIKDGPGKLTPPLYLDPFKITGFFNDAYSLNTEWKTVESIKIFQAEEFKTESTTIDLKGKQYFPARYIHAEYNLLERQFRHFDGAIFLYSKQEYLTRRHLGFTSGNKSKKTNEESIKLFKFNGNIDVNSFIEFSEYFFSMNPLIYEYFHDEYPPYIINMLSKLNKSNSNH